MRKKCKPVHGWGINDVEYAVTKSAIINGKKKTIWICPYYRDWKGLLDRVFYEKQLQKRPRYRECSVCSDWKYFSNFIKWVDSQPNRDWQNCSPDKDLLLDCNKEYNVETVVYISTKVNNFLLDNNKSRGDLMIGVTPSNTNKNPYKSRCKNPFTKKRENLGNFTTELEAHKAWQAKKHEYACQLADLQDDPRVADALRQRYSEGKDWTKR